MIAVRHEGLSWVLEDMTKEQLIKYITNLNTWTVNVKKDIDDLEAELKTYKEQQNE